jgi:hypothetical protein
MRVIMFSTVSLFIAMAGRQMMLIGYTAPVYILLMMAFAAVMVVRGVLFLTLFFLPGLFRHCVKTKSFQTVTRLVRPRPGRLLSAFSDVLLPSTLYIQYL